MYPFPIVELPAQVADSLASLVLKQPRASGDRPHLDLLYFQPSIPSPLSRDLFIFLRDQLPFYRVRYTIRRGPTESEITTPRFTTVFGVDETAQFVAETAIASISPDSLNLVDRVSKKPVPREKYHYAPRPLPACLDLLRQRVEAATGMAPPITSVR